VRITAPLYLLRQQQRWAWIPLPMVLVPGVSAPAELVGLVTEPQPGQRSGPFGARGQLAHERVVCRRRCTSAAGQYEEVGLGGGAHVHESQQGCVVDAAEDVDDR
jgi:hypothetical protein